MYIRLNKPLRTFNALSDQELIDLIKAGNEAAFTEVYERYWRLIYAHVFKMLKDEEEAKDIVQEIFSNVWLRADKIPAQSNFAGYLYVTARNKVLNAIRQHKFRNDYLTSLAAFATEASEETRQYLDERELMALIEREINALPPRMREVFNLSRKQNLSYKAIGEYLGTSEATVKKQMSRSLKVIRLNLKSSGGAAMVLLTLMR